MRQLTFDLTRPPSFDADDFLESASNAEAVAVVTRWPDWPHRTLLLIGPEGCGKSHLGAIWAAHAGARVVRSGDPALTNDERPPIVFVEDCDRAGHEEAALFHLLNLSRERDGWVLLTARRPPDFWGIGTPDLLSRLRLAPAVPIGAPDPYLIRAVIVKLFADRQIRIDEDVVAYAARHCEQSLDAVNRFVAAVDNESLAAGRRITRLLAAKAITSLGGEEPELDHRSQRRNQGPT